MSHKHIESRVISLDVSKQNNLPPSQAEKKQIFVDILLVNGEPANVFVPESQQAAQQQERPFIGFHNGQYYLFTPHAEKGYIFYTYTPQPQLTVADISSNIE